MSYSQEESDLLRENNVLKGQLAAQAALSAKLREAMELIATSTADSQHLAKLIAQAALSLTPTEAEEAAKRELEECREVEALK